MGYPATVDTGVVGPLIIGTDAAAIAGGVTATLTGPGTPMLFAFELQAPLAIHQVRWRMGATTTGHTNIAIYTAAGALVAGSDTGAIANIASTTQTQTYTNDVLLSSGQYYLAIACDNTTDTYEGLAGVANRASVSRYRAGTNVLSGGAMPATLGTISNAPGTAVGYAAIPTGSPIA